MKIPDTNKLMSIFMLIGIIVALFIVYKVLNSFGLVKTAAQKRDIVKNKAAVSDIRVDQYFDPDYYSDKSFHGLDVDVAIETAKHLRNAMAGLGTDEEAIYAIFGHLPSKTAISQLSYYYKRQYGFPFYIMSDNLRVDLLNELNAEEVKSLMDIIDNLPES